ncbi:hypothetical protein FF38_09398 [Lucilia cuprina]|uniref:Uncharacterized protein n=1 Tax=Lucilia cuprina TaxID=7375 RepID=A0A0L0CQX8_LUCCU|nr:hypothetical protein FF38_09398 [Lucilia cuprina]
MYENLKLRIFWWCREGTNVLAGLMLDNIGFHSLFLMAKDMEFTKVPLCGSVLFQIYTEEKRDKMINSWEVREGGSEGADHEVFSKKPKAKGIILVLASYCVLRVYLCLNQGGIDFEDMMMLNILEFSITNNSLHSDDGASCDRRWWLNSQLQFVGMCSNDCFQGMVPSAGVFIQLQ